MSSDADLSLAERDALHAYARRHGRTWKSSLRDDWMRGRAEGPLQRIRNRLGPRWLAAYRVARVNPARPKKADCSRAGKNLATRKSTRAGRALQACAPRSNPLPKGQSVWSVLYRDGNSGDALYAQVYAANAADARHAFHTMTQDAAHTVSRVIRGAPSPEQRAGRTFAGRFSNPDNVRDNPSPPHKTAKVIGAKTVSWTVRGATFRRRFLLLRQGGALDWIEASPLGHLVGFVSTPARDPEMSAALIDRGDAREALAAFVARRGSGW
jgi:hypothetical protein